MLEKITDKIDTKSATDRLSKTQAGALIVLFTFIILLLLGLLLTNFYSEKKQLRKEKEIDHAECFAEKMKLQNQFDSLQRVCNYEYDSLQRLNYELRENLAEYRIASKFNIHKNYNEIILTPKPKNKK